MGASRDAKTMTQCAPHQIIFVGDEPRFQWVTEKRYRDKLTKELGAMGLVGTLLRTLQYYAISSGVW